MPVLWSYTYRSSFKSPSLIHPAFRQSAPKNRVKTAGSTKQMSRMPGHIIEFPLPAWRCRCRSSDETAGSHAGTGWNIFQMEDHRGERVTIEASVGGIQIFGFRTIFPIWSIEVPSPCARRPPHLFSQKLKTANPTICAQQPAVAAPPARPSRLNMMQIAALLIGSVRAMPIRAETRIPMKAAA